MENPFDISIEQGTTLNLTVIATDQSGNVINLSGYNTTGQIFYGYGSDVSLMPLNVTIDPSFVSGLMYVNLTSSGSAKLPVTQAIYNVSVNNSGFSYVVSEGYVFISPGLGYSIWSGASGQYGNAWEYANSWQSGSSGISE